MYLKDMNPVIRNIVRKLRNKKICISDIQNEYANDINILKEERKLGLRKSGKKGFDIINQEFFVEEEIYNNEMVKEIKTTFKNFKDYYEFLDGDVYDNASYYQYKFLDDFSKERNIDLSNLKNNVGWKTIDDYNELWSEEEQEEYKQGEKIKKECKKWIEKFNLCVTYEQLIQVYRNYKKSRLSKKVKSNFFLFQYVYKSKFNSEMFDVIMKYISEGEEYSLQIMIWLCIYYDSNKVLEKFRKPFGCKNGTELKQNENRKRIINFISNIKEANIEISESGYFSKLNHYYCNKIFITECNENHKNLYINIYNYFETFDEFIKFKNYDLRDCDLSSAVEIEIDCDNVNIDLKTTKLPIKEKYVAEYRVKKWYDNGKFYVGQFWCNKNGIIIKETKHIFDYFFEFVLFLKGDLSDANLIFCDGLVNLIDIDNIKLDGVKLTSNVCRKLGIKYVDCKYDDNLITSFDLTKNNEQKTNIALKETRNEMDLMDNGEKYIDYNINRIYYISDLHLMHKIQNADCKSEEDIVYVIGKIVRSIIKESGRILLIGGDVSSRYTIFELFIRMLRSELDKGYINKKVIFVLGNHEFWDFSNLSIDQIVAKYSKLLSDNGMYLLFNGLFYINEINDVGIISYDDLKRYSNNLLIDKLKHTRIVIFGATGFSGFNDSFNSINGIYRNTIDRNTEIAESKKTKKLYEKLRSVLIKKNTIIFTHMPKIDWCGDENYEEKFVYVSGHTHWNQFYDDGIKRIYADNQIGYDNNNPHIKDFLIDDDYDCFYDYDDGIYEITRQQYKDFYRGKNVKMTFEREVNIIYMLKKKGYYCFIHKTKNGSYMMLNGGRYKRLEKRDINYYYENMDNVISRINEPLNKYECVQKCIAGEIKKIGGDGKIHGCIVDIDWYNHIYINPFDFSVVAYWAENMVNKQVYKNIPELLKCECPQLYLKYQSLIEKSEFKYLVPVQKNKEIKSRFYGETDIYWASREISKMQRIDKKILCIWIEEHIKNNKLLDKAID